MTIKHNSDFITGCKYGWIIYLVTLFILGISDYSLGKPINLICIVYIISIISGIFFVPLLTILFTKCFPVIVKTEGLRSYNAFGFYKDIIWEDIRNIKLINLLGVKYIRIYSISKESPIWIPLWLKDNHSFLKSIKSCGGNNEMFSVYFEPKASNKALK